MQCEMLRWLGLMAYSLGEHVLRDHAALDVAHVKVVQQRVEGFACILLGELPVARCVL